MEVRKITIPTITAVLVIATVLLYIKVNGSQATEVDPAALAKAESEYKASSARSSAKTRTPRRSSSERQAASAARELPDEDDEVDEVAKSFPPPREERLAAARGALKSTLTLPTTHPGGGSDAVDDQSRPWSERRLAVNKLYDRKRYDEARKAALRLLDEKPTDRKMLRVVVSSSCIMFEPDMAREYFQKLKERDKKTMRKRCARYGVDDLD